MANVRRRSPQEKTSSPQNIFNSMSDWYAWARKTGSEAQYQAEEVESNNKSRKNSGKKTKVVKVDSNPVPTGKTRMGNLARGGGAGGGAFIENLK